MHEGDFAILSDAYRIRQTIFIVASELYQLPEIALISHHAA